MVARGYERMSASAASHNKTAARGALGPVGRNAGARRAGWRVAGHRRHVVAGLGQDIARGEAAEPAGVGEALFDAEVGGLEVADRVGIAVGMAPVVPVPPGA